MSYGDIALRKPKGTDIVRVYPNAVIEIYPSGSDTLVTTVTANASGNWEVPVLATGIYDIKIDGQKVRTIHHITVDHTHKPNENWNFHFQGSINADIIENNATRIYSTDIAGTIEKIKWTVQHLSAAADFYLHILKGAANGSAVFDLSDTVWNIRVVPGVERFHYADKDASPALVVAADEVVTVGVDYIAGTIEGLTVIVIYRPD